MKVTVFHQDFFNSRNKDAVDFVKMAEVDASHADTIMQALEYAYRYTNNVDGSWSIKREVLEYNGETFENGDYNPAVTVIEPLEDDMGHRSSMMGDHFVVEGGDLAEPIKYQVAMMGFTPVTEEV